FGYAQADIAGRPLADLFDSEDRSARRPADLCAIAQQRGVASDSVSLLRKGPRHFFADMVVTPLLRDGALRGYLIVVRDVSERRRNEDLQRRSAELVEQSRLSEAANRLKSEFLANMSHELRTPLNAIIGFAELMHDGRVGDVNAEQKEFLGDILISGRHLPTLHHDALDWDKAGWGKGDFVCPPIDRAARVREARDLLRALIAPRRIALETHVDPALTDVVADESKLRQVLYNYLSNA